LTNEDIVKLVKGKLPDAVIISKIKTSRCRFDTSPEALLKLKAEGVSDAVLQAMVEASTPKTESGATGTGDTPDPPTDPSGVPPVTEIGVYYKKGDQWVELMPEVVNWRTGGVIKSAVTMGIVKGDVNGMLLGPHSRNVVAMPVEILIYAPEGVAITEYQLLRLRQKSDRREFRTVTGGVFHASGGAARDLVPFESRKIAPRMWIVILSNLGPGEYGFLAPGAAFSQHASAQLGKMYTFRVLASN
jgi:hypothetical protein